MLKLSRLTDYAIVLLARIELDPADQLTAQELAEAVLLPQPVVAKILKALARAEILVSQRGAHGGYRLVRPSHKLSIFDVITAIDGPVMLTACVEGSDEDCACQKLCPLNGRWQPVNDAVENALRNVTLASMIQSPPAFSTKQTDSDHAFLESSPL